jgi:HK97 family phage major capsid protein
MTKHFIVPGSVLAMLALAAPAFAVVFADADDAMALHRDRQQKIMESSTAIMARAEAENRDMTAAEVKEVEDLTKEFDGIEAQIKAREGVLARNAVLTAPRGRQTDPDDLDGDTQPQNRAAAPQARVPAQPRATAGGMGGFRHLGEFAASVRNASMRGGDLDPRLRNAAVSTYGNEGTGADGGFAVPPDMRTEIMSKVFNEDSLLAMTDRLQSSSNTITLPTDETTPWQSSGGIQSYWTAEGGTKTQSKPSLGETTLKLHTLATLVPVTEELLEDAPAMGAYLNRKAPEKMDFKVSDSIVRGTGVGMPLGYLNSPSLVTVLKESGQAADTINVTNLAKMWGRMPVQSRRSAIWLMHPDAEAQLPLMSLANQPVYMPPGGVSGNMYGTLWGRPVIPHQVAETIGDLGDVQLVDLKQYLTVTKTGNGRDANGMRQDVSIHLWFDQDMVAYRFTMRIAGAPWWAAAIAQRDGTNTQSPFVVLEAR